MADTLRIPSRPERRTLSRHFRVVLSSRSRQPQSATELVAPALRIGSLHPLSAPLGRLERAREEGGLAEEHVVLQFEQSEHPPLRSIAVAELYDAGP